MQQDQTAIPSLVEQLTTMIIRHGLTWVAGVLTTWGILDKDATQQFITLTLALAMGGAGMLLSYIQKRVAKSRLIAAIVAQPAEATVNGTVVATPTPAQLQ